MIFRDYIDDRRRKKRKVNKDNDYLKLFLKDGEDALTEKELSEIIEEELSKPELCGICINWRLQ